MQSLVTTRRVMMWLYMCPADESTNAQQQRTYVAHTLIVLFSNLISFTAGLAFCLKYIPTDFNDAVFAFMIAVGEFGLIYIMIAAILMRHRIDGIFTGLTTIYKTNENGVAFRFLAQANNTSEWMWTIYFKYIAVAVAGAIIMSIFSVLYCYLTQGDFNVDHFYRPGNYVLPWNQTTPVGYIAETFCTLPIGYGYFIVNGAPLILFVSLCLHHQAFYKMFKHSIDKAEECDAKMLCDLIRFHISAKDFFLQTANVYSQFLLVQLICNTVLMTCSVFYLDLQWQQFDSTMFCIMASTSVGITNLFIYCYFGKLATESYEMMSDCVFNMNWHEQPIGLQKYFILMIANIQKPVYYHGFEVAKMDLRTFIKMCNSVFKYYMAIKTLAVK